MTDLPEINNDSLRKSEKDKQLTKVNSDKMFSPQIEGYILGALITYTAQLRDYLSNLNKKDFYLDGNGFLFVAITKALDMSENIEPMVLSDYYSKIADISPAEALSRIERICSPFNNDTPNEEIRRQFISTYQILKTYSTQREMQLVAKTMLTQSVSKTPDEMIKYLGELSSNFSQSANSIVAKEDKTRHISDSVNSLFKKIHDNVERGIDRIGIHTGFGKFDDATTGYEGGQLIILAARPSMGKTAMLVAKNT